MSILSGARLSGLVELLRIHETKFRFIAAGGLNTVFGLVAFPLLMWLLHDYALHYLIVLMIAQAFSMVFAYLTTKFLVFRTRGRYFSEFGKFVTFHLTNFALNLVGLPILVEFARLPPVWAQLGFALTVIVTSYFWHSRITFQSRRPEP